MSGAFKNYKYLLYCTKSYNCNCYCKDNYKKCLRCNDYITILVIINIQGLHTLKTGKKFDQAY